MKALPARRLATFPRQELGLNQQNKEHLKDPPPDGETAIFGRCKVMCLQSRLGSSKYATHFQEEPAGVSAVHALWPHD